MSDDDDPPPRTTTTKKAKKTRFVVIDDTHPKGIKRVDRFTFAYKRAMRARKERQRGRAKKSSEGCETHFLPPAPRIDGRGGRGVEEANGDSSEEEETRER